MDKKWKCPICGDKLKAKNDALLRNVISLHNKTFHR